MILCPKCLHKEMLGAFFCSECGAQLVYSEEVRTNEIKGNSTNLEEQTANNLGDPLYTTPPTSFSNSVANLNFISTGDILPLSREGEFTLGRVSKGQAVIPNIDLTPYKAYEAGVSRIHASLHITGDEITVTDLGSANGTRINGIKITSQISHQIKHGDIVSLGKFKIQVLFQKNKWR